MPTLLGEDVAGHQQTQHEYLYWELGHQTAVRSGNWKAIQPSQNKEWELYDLDRDVSEQHDIARERPDVLARLRRYADAAHQPVREGVILDRSLIEKDRRAKFGNRGAARTSGNVQTLPKEGLLPNQKWRIVRASSEAAGNGRLAAQAIDGNPTTHWHTQFSPTLKKHPHELVIDLGAAAAIRGFRYLARQDGGWNGAIAKCAFAVSDSPSEFPETAVETTFKKTKLPQEVACNPVQGRYVRIRIYSEVNGGPWASIAELGVVGESSK